LLTSGQAPSVPEGLALLARLVQRAGDRLVVMPGGGVREHNIGQVLAATGARAVHFTAGEPVRRGDVRHRPEVELGSRGAADHDGERVVTSAERVRQFRAAAGLAV
jgi:copper homeostasis protein